MVQGQIISEEEGFYTITNDVFSSLFEDRPAYVNPSFLFAKGLPVYKGFVTGD